MRQQGRIGFGCLALLLACGLPAADVRAVTITVYGELDLDARRAAASDRIRDVLERPPAGSATAIDLMTTQQSLSTAPFEISLRRGDELWLGALHREAGPGVDPSR